MIAFREERSSRKKKKKENERERESEKRRADIAEAKVPTSCEFGAAPSFAPPGSREGARVKYIVIDNDNDATTGAEKDVLLSVEGKSGQHVRGEFINFVAA